MKEFDMFNGLRIVMKPPVYPCKLGVHLEVSMGNEYELFVGHLLDTENPEKDKWQSYEIPILNLHNDTVVSKVLHPQHSNNIQAGGLVFKTESDQPLTSEDSSALHFDIKKIDFIYNPEYDELRDHYKLPVFFKSAEDQKLTLISQGFVDNGRQIV